MRFRLLLFVAVMLAAATQSASSQSSGNALAAVVLPRKVISWVPPYAIPQSLARLKSSFYSSAGPRNSLTHLGLQFWTPKLWTQQQPSVLKRSAQATITNANIKTFVDWGHANGIKVMLCVFNGDAGWDWPLAKQAFKAHQTLFINALIAEMQAQKLDGIDIDLEGVGDFETDKGAYIAFVKELARRVHLLHKIVTVDSFPWKWNAPNWNWWAPLFPLVDGVNSMGYEDLGRNTLVPADGWRKYSAQKAKAGTLYSAKLQIGLPSYLSAWQGNTTLQQVQWFRIAQAGRVGIAIWDAQFPDVSWKSAPVWTELKAIRATP